MQKKLLIDGMSCGHCVKHLKTALTEDIKGIKKDIYWGKIIEV